MDNKTLDALINSITPMEETTRYFKAIIYGDPGTFKTCLSSGIGDKILFIEADPAGWDSLYNHSELNPLLNPGRYERMKYQGLSQLTALATAINEQISPFDKFDTVNIDTGSYIADLDLDIVIRERMKKKGDSWDDVEDMWPTYRQHKERAGAAFHKIFLSPVNVVMTAHSRELKIKKDSIESKITAPDFIPSVLKKIEGLAKVIIRTSAKQVQRDNKKVYIRQAQFHPTASIMAKSHIGSLDTIIEIPEGDVLFLRKIVDNWLNSGGVLRPEDEVKAQIKEELDLGSELLS